MALGWKNLSVASHDYCSFSSLPSTLTFEICIIICSSTYTTRYKNQELVCSRASFRMYLFEIFPLFLSTINLKRGGFEGALSRTL